MSPARSFRPTQGLAWSLLVLMACVLQGCLYVPPVTHTASSEGVLSIQPGVDTRASVRKKIGKPNVLELAAAYAWGWEVNRGTLIAGFYPAYGWSFGSGAHRVLVQFKGDQVISVEHAQCDRQDPRRREVGHSVNQRVSLTSGRHRYTLEASGELIQQDLSTLEERTLLPAWETPEFPKWDLNQQALAISPDGRWVVTWWAGVVRIWDLKEMKVAASMRPPPPMTNINTGGGGPNEIHFTASGDRILLGCPMRGLGMLATQDWKFLWVSGEGYQRPLAMNPDGTRLIAGVGRGLRLFDGRTGQMIGGFEPRGLERWFNTNIEADWPDFRLEFLSPGVIQATGPTTRERWSLADIERRFREGRGRVRVDKDRVEPALLGVELLRFAACP